MTLPHDPFGLALLAWALSYAGAHATAIARGLRPAPAPQPAGHLPVGPRTVVVRPCAGAEPALVDNLLSTGELAGVTGARIVFAVGDPDDAAFGPATRAAAVLREGGLDARVCVTRAQGPNHKAAQLARALEELGEARELVAVFDSDLDLRGASLEALAAPLAASSDTAAVWIPPVEDGRGGGPGARVCAAILGASLHAFPLLVHLDPATLVGKAFLVRRAALARAGGFEALRSVLGEDLELARRLRAGGGRVVALPGAVTARPAHRTLAGTTDRFARWLSVLRAQRPALLLSYPLLFSAAPLILVLALVAGPLGHAAAWIALASRLAAALAALRLGGARLDPLWPLWALCGDVLLLVACVKAIRTRRVTWRGRTLELGAGGVLYEA